MKREINSKLDCLLVKHCGECFSGFRSTRLMWLLVSLLSDRVAKQDMRLFLTTDDDQ